jgi:Protein kinase domain
VDQTGDAVADAVDDTTRESRRIGYIGKNLGRFSIRAELGRGGMATVYRAHDPQLGRDVAIKVMHGFLAGRADLEARFRREASAVAGIRHPSVLALYDFSPPRGEEPGYLVSELIDGPDLRHLMDARPRHMLPESALLLGAQIADALGAAHDAGVVHRDVKPDNVLIDRGAPRVLLTDFGVAHVGGLDTMTATGAVLGSPAYMSPEQARGDDVGPPSDVFSLGVLLYQLCTGHLPFSGKDPLTMLSAILRGEFTRPARLDPHVGPELEAVILRCLDRDPGARFATGRVAAVALRCLWVETGIGDETAALRAFLRDADAFESGLSQRIAGQAREAAEGASRRRQRARALAEIGRALAYAPDDARAQASLAQMAKGGGRWRRSVIGAWGGALAAGGVVAAVVVIALSVLRWRGGEAPGPMAVAVAGPTREPLLAANGKEKGKEEGTGDGVRVTHSMPEDDARKEMARPPHVSPAPSERRTSSARANLAGLERARERAGQRRGRAGVGEDMRATAALLPAVEGRDVRPGRVAPPDDQIAQIANTQIANVVTPVARDRPEEGASTRREASPQTASAGISLRASHGFCEPSLDDHEPSLRASYTGLVPGPHDVYCTVPQGGPKVLVARYELKPGTRPSLSIVPGPAGKPMLARPD